MLSKIIQMILTALFGAVKDSINEKREDQAKVDLGTATQAAATSAATIEKQQKIVAAAQKARKSNVKDNLRSGNF